jgi:hypothetical protein
MCGSRYSVRQASECGGEALKAQVEAGLNVREADTAPYYIQLVKLELMAGVENHERAIVSKACSTKQIADE